MRISIFPTGGPDAVRATDPNPLSARRPASVDQSSISGTARLLGALGKLRQVDPEKYQELLATGAQALRALEDAQPMADALAADDPRAMAQTLDPMTAEALLQRVEAALGLRPPPFGPWFPRRS